MNRNTIVLTKYHNALLYLNTGQKETLDLQLFFDSDESPGSIYVCEIKDVEENIGSSFINYGSNKKGFLKSTAYKPGTQLPLQLKSIPASDKAPVFSDKLTLHGLYTVVTTADRKFCISGKIDKKRKKEMLLEYGTFLKDLEYGVTLRTNSQDAPIKDVLCEADALAGILDDIISESKSRTPGTVLYRNQDGWIDCCLTSTLKSVSRVITDDSDIFDTLNDTVLDRMKEIKPDIYASLYSDRMLPLHKLYSVEARLKKALDPKVWLPSGGFIIIEQTEALTAIDVNTGKCSLKKNKAETVLNCNLEATEEICRQLRARNLSGIIIIDYINMDNDTHLKQVLQKLKTLIAADTVKTDYHDFTALGLVELTRQKIREPLAAQMKKLRK
ncbi:MAG: ribonuclease E/G [Lachnospiraceae bacterium]|nr:ribonuclease E/G [Lachnospiraceae bacterium]